MKERGRLARDAAGTAAVWLTRLSLRRQLCQHGASAAGSHRHGEALPPLPGLLTRPTTVAYMRHSGSKYKGIQRFLCSKMLIFDLLFPSRRAISIATDTQKSNPGLGTTGNPGNVDFVARLRLFEKKGGKK
jgi:hypothetical protein